MSQPILTRDGLTALRQLHQLLPFALPETLLDVATWAIDLAGIEEAPVPAELAIEAARILRPAPPAPTASPASAPAVVVDDVPIPAPPEIVAQPVPPPAPPPASARNWPEDDVAQLRALLALGLGWREIGERMGRSEASIRVFAGRNRLGPLKPPSDWSEEHSAMLLRMLAEGSSIDEIGRAVDRSRHAVQSRIRKIRESAAYKAAMAARRERPAVAPRSKIARRAWTPEEDARLVDLIGGGSDFRAIGEAMGRTAQSCESRAQKLRSKARPPSWTAEEDRRLLHMREAGHVTSAMAKALGRSEGTVKARIHRLRDVPPPAPAAIEPAPPPAPTPEPVAPPPAPPAPVAAPRIGISTGPARPAAMPAPMSAREHEIEGIRAHLDRMPWDERFDAAMDYAIARRLLAGARSGALAEELGLPLSAMASRFKAMIPASIRDCNDRVTIDGRGLLLEALRLNAEEDGAEA